MKLLFLYFNLLLLGIHLTHIFLFQHFDTGLLDEWTALLLHSTRSLIFFTPTYIIWMILNKKIPKEHLKKFALYLFGFLFLIIEIDYIVTFVFKHEPFILFFALSFLSAIIAYLLYKIITNKNAALNASHP